MVLVPPSERAMKGKPKKTSKTKPDESPPFTKKGFERLMDKAIRPQSGKREQG